MWQASFWWMRRRLQISISAFEKTKPSSAGCMESLCVYAVRGWRQHLSTRVPRFHHVGLDLAKLIERLVELAGEAVAVHAEIREQALLSAKGVFNVAAGLEAGRSTESMRMSRSRKGMRFMRQDVSASSRTNCFSVGFLGLYSSNKSWAWRLKAAGSSAGSTGDWPVRPWVRALSAECCCR
jgi:hypothetical protein